MKKIILIGIKDVRLAFRDRAAIILMLLAPFLLTIGMGFITGRLSGGSASGISGIGVVLVNQDDGELGEALTGLFESADLADLLEPAEMGDLEAARLLLEGDETAAVVFIPPGFTESIVSPTASDPPQIEMFINPAQPVSAGVVQTIVEAFISQVETGRVGAQVAVEQLLRGGLIGPQQAQEIGRQVGERQAALSAQESPIHLETVSSGEEPVEFDVLAYMAPGMALMFLMFTVSYGGRSILAERNGGTLPRLLVSPTSTLQVLGGKILGIYLTGVLQVSVLILASSLLFGLRWGSPLGVLVLVLAAVFGATGWGMLITAAARTPGQVASIGSAIMLTFGILGGSFISLDNLPIFVQWISKLTPNAWGMDGFTALALGDALPDIWLPVLALLLMGFLLFGIAVALFNRQNLLQA